VVAIRFAAVFWFEQVALVAAAQIATHLMAAVSWIVVPQVQQPSVG